MSVGGLPVTDDGYRCGDCGSIIPPGDDAIVAMNADVDVIEQTGDPQVVTYSYEGIYHPECFHGG